MATTIHGVSRYASDGSAITTFNGMDSQFGMLHVEQIPFYDATVTNSVMAPVTGKLVACYVTSQTTTTGDNKVGLAVENESNSSASMLSTTLFDDDPVLTTNVAAECTLSTTAANLAVDKGDNLEVAYTETGAIAGGCIMLYFEPSDD